jgi:predicted alpha/beta hydrolase
MSNHPVENTADPMPPITVMQTGQAVFPISVGDGVSFELLCVHPGGAWHELLYWLSALGVPARHYLPLAEALAEQGIAVAIHEWRGIGSSNLRAGRQQDWAYRELLVDDVPAGLAAVRRELPHTRCWIGGHSLGGQLSTVYAGLHPEELAGLVLVATGSPYWRRFRYGRLIVVAYALAPLLAKLCGYLPGRRIGFGGNEARGVIRDWARTGRSGRYAADHMGDLEAGMAALERPVLALRLQDDWLGPADSLDWLLGKLPLAHQEIGVVTPEELHGPADHFGWMKMPVPVAARIAQWLVRQEA